MSELRRNKGKKPEKITDKKKPPAITLIDGAQKDSNNENILYIKADSQDLKAAIDQLKENGYSFEDISNEIGAKPSSIRNAYYSDTKLTKDAFNLLEELVGRDIIVEVEGGSHEYGPYYIKYLENFIERLEKQEKSLNKPNFNKALLDELKIPLNYYTLTNTKRYSDLIILLKEKSPTLDELIVYSTDRFENRQGENITNKMARTIIYELFDILNKLNPDWFDISNYILEKPELQPLQEELAEISESGPEDFIKFKKLSDGRNSLTILWDLLNENNFSMEQIETEIQSPYSVIKTSFNNALLYNALLSMQKYNKLKKWVIEIFGKDILTKLFGIDEIPHKKTIDYKRPEIWAIIQNKGPNDKYLSDLLEELNKKGITQKDMGVLLGNNEFQFYDYIRRDVKIRDYIFERLKVLVKTLLDENILFSLYQNHSKEKLNLKKSFKENLIPHEIQIGEFPNIKLEKNIETAGFICTMLGDGALHKDGRTVNITLNRVDEPEFVKLITENFKNLFDLEDKDLVITEYEDGKAIRIETKRQNIHYALIEAGKRVRDNNNGLVPGKKSQNQVGVADWILSTIEYCIRGIARLFDTDGSVRVRRNKGYLTIMFSNVSKTLVDDYYEMCKQVGIECHPPRTTEYKGNIYHTVEISKLEQVKKFLEIITPEKLKEPIRRMFVALEIIAFNLPDDLKNVIEQEINRWKRENNLKQFRYSIESTQFLLSKCKDLFAQNNIKEVFGIPYLGEVDESIINRAIEIGYTLNIDRN